MDACCIITFGSYEFLNPWYRAILAEVIVCIFAHLHRALRKEGKVSDIN